MSDHVREPDITELYIEVDPPIQTEIFEPEIVPKAKGQELSYEERVAIKAKAEVQGFTRGAIVVKRSYGTYARAIPTNWGVVIDTQVWEHDLVNKIFAPIKIQWVEKGVEEYMFHEDLIMVHYAPEAEDLELIRSGE